MASFFFSLISNLFLQYLFLFFSSSYLVYNSSAIQQNPLCRDGDRSSLLQFKESFVFDKSSCDPSTDYSKLSSWKVSDDCCYWDGVNCNNQTGHVIGLDLSSSCLYGSINSSSPLFQLVHLTNLDLSLNDFNLSRIPSGIASLSKLKHLDLSSSNFFGEIPSEIFNLSNIRFISLQYNSDLTGHLLEFPAGSQLEILELDGANFSRQIPLSIGNLKSLSMFTAADCRFQGPIPSLIGNLTKLSTLDLYDNYFSGNIPSSLANLFQLKSLSLSFNDFNSTTLHWLGKLTNLQILNLWQTNSYGPIPSSLKNLTQLQEVRLFSNHLTGQIPSWMGNLTRLTILGLGGNELEGEIPESFFGLQNLQALQLEHNNLSGSLKFDLFLQMKYLYALQLSESHLSLVNSPYINTTLPQFQTLELIGCNLKEFPSFLRGQNEIKSLELGSNNIKGYVPNWISTLESLTYLNLANNSLTGFEQPFSLPNLHRLVLTSNEFQGPLPSPPPSISVYEVSRNKFSGEISPFFCNLTSVYVLDLSNNNLRGDLPPCLGSFGDSALVLDLSYNRFTGNISDTFTGECMLKQIDFSQNKIEGNVPKSLANCSKLEILNFGGNQMNGFFPSWLGVLPNLRILSLRSNQFHGVIGQPLSKFEFSQLQIIDLSDNNFTGKLPVEYFQNWVVMRSVDNDDLAYMQAETAFNILGDVWLLKYTYSISLVNKGTKREYDRILEFFVVIDLSSNKFEGEIPEVIGTLKELQSLNLSNNMLTGHIPSSLGSLTKLEALDLSLNNFSGEIPIQISSLTFLAFFNVSHNGLTGPVPQGNQFDTFDNDSFLANPRLCGNPLSKKCGDTKTLPLPPSEDEDEDENSPFKLNWEIVLIGFSSGLVIGVAFGWALDTRKYERLAKKKFARWQRRRLRNL